MSVEEGRKEIKESRDLSAIDGERKNRQEEMGTRDVPIESGDVPRSKDFEDRLTTAGVVSRIFAGQPMAWARHSLEKLPVKMTLGNLGLCAVVLAVLMPRSFTYMLVYPVFRLVFGTLYPAYASYKAVRTRNVKEYVKWMMYWIVFALFTCAETFTDVFLSFWFPFYYEIKIILVLWLLSPATKGSSILYRRFVHPALIRREAEIDDALARATEQGYTAVLHLGTKGVNYATTVLMQTAIKGGGGLVQQLRKSYSLSDLTGEKEDENRNTADVRDGTDMQDVPRRREHPGRRGYSPRRTQSGSNRVEMYFSEVDVDVRQPRSREPVASLTNIKSSEDISSGYSSGEALHSHRASIQGESLVRTSSVGARTRAKSRPATKKTPEDPPEDSDYDDHSTLDNVPVLPSTPLLTPDQVLELLVLISQSKSLRPDDVPQSGPNYPTDTSPAAKKLGSESRETSEEFVDSLSDMNQARSGNKEPTSPEVAVKRPSETNVEVDTFSENNVEPKSEENTCTTCEKSSSDIDLQRITSEICQDKFDELRQLLDNAHKAVANIVSVHGGGGKMEDSNAEVSLPGSLHDLSSNHVITNENDTAAETRGKESSLEASTLPSQLMDDAERAGKYHKKPAPKAPTTKCQVEPEGPDFETQNALKATLVIKTGTVKTVTSASYTKDIFLTSDPSKPAKKKSPKSRTKEGFSKLLTIPKNIIHNAFHKDDSRSVSSEGTNSRSRTSSIDSREIQADFIKATEQKCVDEAVLQTIIDEKSTKPEEVEGDEQCPSVSGDSESEELTDKTVFDKEEYEREKAKDVSDNVSGTTESSEKASAGIPKLRIRQMSRSPTRGGKKLHTDAN